MSEPIEDDGTEVHFGHLTVKVSGAEPFSQEFETAHFSLNATAPMITIEAFPALSPPECARSERGDCVSEPPGALFPEPSLVSRRNQRLGRLLGNGFMTVSGIVRPIGTDTDKAFLAGQLMEELREY